MQQNEPSTPSFKAISDYVYHYAQTQPIIEAVKSEGTSTTYATLAADIDTCAKTLLALGVQKGDRVATLSPPSLDFFTLFLATTSIGAIWVGLNPKYTDEELRYVVMDARPKVIFSRLEVGDRNYKNTLNQLNEDSDTTEHIIVLGGARGFSDTLYSMFLDQPISVTTAQLREVQRTVERIDPALIVYTSGTTGRPKGALLPHGGLIECSETQNRVFACSEIKLVNFLPINHIGCVGDLSCYVLVAGGTLIFLEQFDPETNLRLMAEENVTVWGGVPTTFLMCLAHPDFDRFDLSSLELIIWSGAAAPKDLVVALSKVHPRMGNCYGQTETVGSITFTAPCSDVDVLANTVGKPPAGYDVRIVGSDGNDVEPGEVGEITIKASFTMNGYWGRQEETREAIDEQGYLHTGDLGLMRPDGNIRLVGRTKEMFKSGGYNVYPREIEQTLESFNGVEMAAVIAVHDPVFGEVGHAFILDPTQTVNELEIKEHCRRLLANYKIPKAFNIKPYLPMLPIGKIDKIALKRHVAAGEAC